MCTTGADSQSHFDNLAELLYRLFAAGLKLNKSKCKFYQSSVKFLGKIVDKDGISMDQDSISAIVNMPAPTDRHTLRAFLGHMSYISRHVPDLRIARAPLDKLLKADTKFVWSNEQSKAFEKCKELASNSATLAHFDINLPIVLTTDASPVGLGACLSHRVKENGKTFLKPLSYASCSLKPAERNYAQVDREGLAVYWAVRHSRQYLYCRKFEIHTDCSALTKIFGPKNDLGTVYVTSVSGPKHYKMDTKQMKLYTAQDYKLDKAAEQTQFFQVITIENNRLTYVAYTTLGEEYDRMVIQKDLKTGKKQLVKDSK